MWGERPDYDYHVDRNRDYRDGRCKTARNVKECVGERLERKSVGAGGRNCGGGKG